MGRGRERRFAGDQSLPRGRYYCLVDSESNAAANNTLIGELFAYADPAFPVQPELLDSTVDVARDPQMAESLGHHLSSPCLLNIVRASENPWIFAPTMGFKVRGDVFSYPVAITEQKIDKVIDLRLPETLDWLMRTFVRLEAETEFQPSAEHQIICTKPGLAPPSDLETFLPLILTQQLGGGSTFVQGIGTWLRTHGAHAIIYPSARSDSKTVVSDGQVVESFGYILLDYRGAPNLKFEAKHHFGALPSWRERDIASVAITEVREAGRFVLEIKGVRLLQEARFAMFHDWTTRTMGRVASVLRDGSEKLGDPVKRVVRKPAEVLGEGAEKILGQDFFIDESARFMPISLFLDEWRRMNNAEFSASVLPQSQSRDWQTGWGWDGRNWFLHRKCLRRPWVVLKCPGCYFEEFWNVLQGVPESACPRCNCDGGNKAQPEISEWRAWAAEILATVGDGLNGDALLKRNEQIYTAACWMSRNAVTGEKPATEQDAVLSTLLPPAQGIEREGITQTVEAGAPAGASQYLICKYCGVRFDAAHPGSCSYHPLEPELVGNRGPRDDYTDVHRFPCCGQVVAADEPARSPGCTQGFHEALSALITCKRCGQPFNPESLTGCSYHPQEAKCVGGTGPRYDWDKYIFPCCGEEYDGYERQLSPTAQPPQSPGCVKCDHEA